LGMSLHLNIVIEGVEKREQVEFLSSLNQSLIIQGYYYAKPMNVDVLVKWLNEHETKLINNEIDRPLSL
ncbi:MAG TPA: hypothetical protein VNR61_09930, partial [Niallia sp.]|nr:hypothetical protein [Niallia sp.]